MRKPQKKRSKPQRSLPSAVRIIGGQWRGSKIAVANRPGLRPTTDRSRETLFNWLMQDLVGARCLDVFAGSGVLGLECISRGAAWAQFIERDKQTALELTATLNRLSKDSAPQGEVLQADALRALSTTPEAPFDIVFLDPPFAELNLLAQSATLLVENAWLAPGAKIYLEFPSGSSIADTPAGWHLLKEGGAGESRMRLYHL